MTLSVIKDIGPGGSGFQGDGLSSAVGILKEVQGLSFDLLAGAAADTKIDVAAIRSEDTIAFALNNIAGTITDITGTMSINSVKASGTLTVVSAIATDVFIVDGFTYTIQAGAPTTYGQVQVGGTDTIMATNMAQAINDYENSNDKVGGRKVTATSLLGVVTVTAVADGVSGNTITISSVDTTITASGATLANGTVTGGVQSTGITNQIILFWFNKR